MKNEKRVDDYIWLHDYITKIQDRLLFSQELSDAMLDFKNLIIETRNKGGRIFFAGNGASETISSHAALDYNNQLAVKTTSINNSSIITCFANDFGYEQIFSRYLKLNACKDDVVVLISSSGKSQNVINAAYDAHKIGMKVVSFTGFDKNNTLHSLANIGFWIDSNVYNVVETIHMIWLVAVCDLIAMEEKDLIGVHGKNI